MPHVGNLPALRLVVWVLVSVLGVGGFALAAQDEPSPAKIFRDARKVYEEAKKNDSRAGMERGVVGLADTNLEEAAKFLLKELMDDQRDRKNSKPGLPGNIRKVIIANLARFKDEPTVKLIGESALKLNSAPVRGGDPTLALDQFDFFLALARMEGSAAADAIVRSALAEAKNPYIKVAALEAVRQAMARRFASDVISVLGEPTEEWATTWTIVPINVFACIERIVEPGDVPNVIRTVKAVIAWEERMLVLKLKTDERVRFFGGRMLRSLTNETADMASIGFWTWWLAQMEATGRVVKSDRPPEKQSKTVSTPVFDVQPVGKRFVFVIDVSKSMELPLKITLEEIEKRRRDRDGPVTGRGPSKGADKPKEAEQPKEQPKEGEGKPAPDQPAPPAPPAPPEAPAPQESKQQRHMFKGDIDEDNPLRDLPWKDIRTRLELAREELSRAIKTFEGDREFAIITYSTDVKCITGGWIPATRANCDKWAAEARRLEAEALTNIHGGLMRALKLSAKGMESKEPSVDPDCVLTGADTVVFLTDGWASWCDTSRNHNTKDPRGGSGIVGDGEFILGDKIWPDILRHNIFRKVVINTVGIGNHDKDLLKSLARETSGTYVDWGFPE